MTFRVAFILAGIALLAVAVFFATQGAPLGTRSVSRGPSQPLDRYSDHETDLAMPPTDGGRATDASASSGDEKPSEARKGALEAPREAGFKGVIHWAQLPENLPATLDLWLLGTANAEGPTRTIALGLHTPSRTSSWDVSGVVPGRYVGIADNRLAFEVELYPGEGANFVSLEEPPEARDVEMLFVEATTGAPISVRAIWYLTEFPGHPVSGTMSERCLSSGVEVHIDGETNWRESVPMGHLHILGMSADWIMSRTSRTQADVIPLEFARGPTIRLELEGPAPAAQNSFGLNDAWATLVLDGEPVRPLLRSKSTGSQAFVLRAEFAGRTGWGVKLPDGFEVSSRATVGIALQQREVHIVPVKPMGLMNEGSGGVGGR